MNTGSFRGGGLFFSTEVLFRFHMEHQFYQNFIMQCFSFTYLNTGTHENRYKNNITIVIAH